MTRIPKVGNYRLDLEALRVLRHRYDARRCSERGCCCSTYEVVIGKRELDRITGWIPLAAQYQPGLIEDGALQNPFDQLERSLWSLDTDEDGTCRFAYRWADGQTRCSIHSAALEHGHDPFRTKPRSCALWPLAVSEGRHPVLSVADDAYTFPCNIRRRRRDPVLDPTVVEVVEQAFGKKFAADVVEACEAAKG